MEGFAVNYIVLAIPLAGLVAWRIIRPRLIWLDIKRGNLKDVRPMFFYMEAVPYGIVAICVHPFTSTLMSARIVLFSIAVFLAFWQIYHGILFSKYRSAACESGVNEASPSDSGNTTSKI